MVYFYHKEIYTARSFLLSTHPDIKVTTNKAVQQAVPLIADIRVTT